MTTFVHAKPSDDPMYGYNFKSHQSADRNFVPGFGQHASSAPSHATSTASHVAPAKVQRDRLSNLWHTYAQNHSANPYTEYHKTYNANIFNHVKERYGIEVAKAMHGHAEALRQGGIYAIRKKYNIMEDKESEAKNVNRDKPVNTKELVRKLVTKFRETQARNRKRLRKISRVYDDQFRV